MLIRKEYKPKDAVEFVFQDIALECRNDPNVMKRGHADAEDFLSENPQGAYLKVHVFVRMSAISDDLR